MKGEFNSYGYDPTGPEAVAGFRDFNPYTENGYENRTHYLACLSEDYDIELSSVLALADVLGPDEDFDGLVVALEDECERREF